MLGVHKASQDYGVIGLIPLYCRPTPLPGGFGPQFVIQGIEETERKWSEETFEIVFRTRGGIDCNLSGQIGR